MTREAKYAIALTALYFLISLVGIWHHELFIDEAHHWLLARDSHSVVELYDNTRIEGHPLLWSLILYALSRFTANPFAMQFVHILISAATVFLFLRKAPFGWIFKILFIFGYFMIFEYNLISRNYMLGVLFLFLACSFFKSRNQKMVGLCALLALAANTHLMFSIIALALFLTVLLEKAMNRELFRKDFMIGYVVFAIGLLSIVIQIQHTDSDWLLDPINRLPIGERLVKGYIAFFKGVVTIPDFSTLFFWNSNWIVNANRTLAAVLALLIYLLPLVLFYKNKKTLFFVYTALIGTQVFFFITQRAATRFHGMTYLILVIALWIETDFRSEHSKLKSMFDSFQLARLKKPIVYAMLIVQLCSGIAAYGMDFRFPFTSAKQTASFIRANHLQNRNIVTVTCDGTLISAYLEKKIWFLCDGGMQGFCHWDNGCVGKVPLEQTASMLTDYMQTHREAIFVSYYPLSQNLQPNVWHPLNGTINFRFLKKFDVTMVDKTNYYLFELQNK